MLTTIGLLYLRIGENMRAFDFLGNSLTHDPKNARTILAAGSIIQDHSDMDVALIKYRVAAVQTPNSAQLWNNVGMCFFGKGRHVAAIACLKKALYLDPFEWIVSYNLGLVHLTTVHPHAPPPLLPSSSRGPCRRWAQQQYASAFHYLSASINLKPDFASSYMQLGICLARLDDPENACLSYQKAIEMETDFLFHLNYAVTLANLGRADDARAQLDAFDTLYAEADEATREADPEVPLLAQRLRSTRS
jgi:Bardet-Biedl syndrome 4 protein